MKHLLILSAFMLTSCQSTYIIPPSFQFHKIETRYFTLASWQKITAPNNAAYKIYIEGDGYAFNHRGKVSNDPTPRNTTLRDIAFNDNSPNVIYLARPCQYIMSQNCAPRHWSTARFAPEVINAEAEAVKAIAQDKETILIGYSGGAQIAGLIASTKPQIKTKKIITIAGNLDHQAWTEYHKLPPLNESISLNDYKENFLKIPQHHYIGEKDTNIVPEITYNFLGKENRQNITIVPQATHGSGYEKIVSQIWKEE